MASKKQNQNPFGMLGNLGELGDIQKFLGPDFFKNLPLPNMQNGSFFGDQNNQADEDEFPNVDVYSRGREIIVVMAIPGLSSSNDVSLAVKTKVLYVKGHIQQRFNSRDDTVILSELHHGSFERDIELPERVLEDQVRAVYRSGLLIVYLVKNTARDATDKFVTIDFGDE